MLALPAETTRERSTTLLPRLQQVVGDRACAELVETKSTVGGGALPLAELPGWAIALEPKSISLNRLSTRLRSYEPAVIGRVQDNRLLIDPRTLETDEEQPLLQALQRALTEGDSDE
jgi:L-seryl-tRNA(Ser) seleniumtransferase